MTNEVVVSLVDCVILDVREVLAVILWDGECDWVGLEVTLNDLSWLGVVDGLGVAAWLSLWVPVGVRTALGVPDPLTLGARTLLCVWEDVELPDCT